jgi:hypothetical protein
LLQLTDLDILLQKDIRLVGGGELQRSSSAAESCKEETSPHSLEDAENAPVKLLVRGDGGGGGKNGAGATWRKGIAERARNSGICSGFGHISFAVGMWE